MFDQLQLADISATVGMIAFATSFSVFAFIVTLALRCPSRKIAHLEHMPLEEEKRS